MKRPRLRRALIGGAVLLAAAWFISSVVWPARVVRMENGSFVRVAGVTYGKTHSIKSGTLKERLASMAPARFFPKWPRALSYRTNTASDTLIVWLYATNIVASFDQFGGGFVCGTNDVELETCRVLVNYKFPGGGTLFGLAVDCFPRHEEKFSLRLRNVYHAMNNTKQAFPLVEIVFSNPLRSTARPWKGSPAPQRVSTGDFVCELKRCEIHLDTPIGTPLSMEWGFTESGVPVTHWKVGRVELEDSTGNFLSERWQSPSESYLGLPPEGYFQRSLLPGVGAWKVRAFVRRTGTADESREIAVEFLVEPTIVNGSKRSTLAP